MTSEYFELSLRGMQRRQPFKSFTVEFVSGERVVVDHPEAMVLRGGLAVFLDASGVPSLFDHESITQLISEPQRASA